MRRSVVLAIDVEPDGRAVLDREHGWRGTNAAVIHLERLRGTLEASTHTQVRFNWFLRLDPQIAGTWERADIVADACPDLIRAIDAHGDFRGIHVHMWRHSSQRGTWFSDCRDAAWLAECVGLSVDAFRSVFGERPIANRFGDRWMSAEALAANRAHGIRLDLTLEPGLHGGRLFDDPHATTGFPDLAGLPRHPYAPDGNDFRKEAVSPGPDDLWFLPLTTSAPSLRAIRRPPFLVRTSRPPNLVLDHETIWSDLRRSLDADTMTPLVLVVRSGDLSHPRHLDNFLQTTQALARHRAMTDSEFLSADEALARWRTERT